MVHDFEIRQPQFEGNLQEAYKQRLTILMLSCMALSATILFRAAYVQLPQNARLEGMAKRQFQARALVRPRRGMIVDRNGEPLAFSVEANSLAANPSKVRNKRALARILARSVDIPYARLFQKLSEKKEFIWVKRHLSAVELRRFKKWRIMDSDGDLVEGLWLVKESDRVYPHGQLGAHILGDVNVDSEGLEGVELWKNDHLRGKVVSVSAIKDALGRPTFIDAEAAKTVQDGEPVTLSIDASLQFEVEQELSNSIRKTGARSGTVIVMNATTGEILAMANEPSFSPNEKGISQERRRNRAITDGYEPGSTVKALLAAGVLSYGGSLTDQVWGEQGSFVLQKHRISEAEAKEKFEWVSLKKMLQVSSNVAAAKFALKLGVDRYLRTLKAFGLGTKSGMGFPGEISGKIPAKKEWAPLTLANIGFGQGILVTPLQMTRAYSAILNGGWLVEPTLLKRELKDVPTSLGTRIISSRVSRELAQGLTSVTEEGGTGIKAALPGYRIAGKTGTSQTVEPNTGKYSHDKYISSFIGFALDVEPKIVVFASLSEPKGVYYAAETAVPLFREVLASVANRCNLPMKPDAISPKNKIADRTNQLIVGGQANSSHDQIKLTQAAITQTQVHTTTSTARSPSLASTELQRLEGTTKSTPKWIMPSLKGLSGREAVTILNGHRLKLEIMGNGVVFSQTPEAGKIVAEGGTIRLIMAEP